MVSQAPLWTVVVVPAVLLLLAGGAVLGDALLAAWVTGRPLAAAVARPLLELPRLLVTRRRVTLAADRALRRLGVTVVPLAAVLAALVVPLGERVTADLGVGVVWFNAMEVLTWAGVWLVGWAPNAAFALIGGYRFVAQALAYELPLMFALIAAASGAGSLRVADIVAAQRHLWFVVWMPVAFVIYLAGVMAFSFLAPFDAPAGWDIGGGVLAEAAGVDMLVLRAGRWLLLAAGAAMAVPLFLGGGAGPMLPAWLWSLVKTVAVLAILVVAHRQLPTIRPDRYVEVAWIVIIPVAVGQALVPALVALNR